MCRKVGKRLIKSKLYFINFSELRIYTKIKPGKFDSVVENPD